ncbi:IS3 family transposase [Maribacter arcticus]|uniref:IS3 family transposase n=1 Tax=Maribacter arcticus TaxID=561365 RepID=UPI003AB99F9E
MIKANNLFARRKRRFNITTYSESFFKSLKIEWVNKHSYSLRLEVELSVFQWIETWYNRRRMHATFEYKSIEEFEIEMFNQNVAV